jgi:hypothetical protein
MSKKKFQAGIIILIVGIAMIIVSQTASFVREVTEYVDDPVGWFDNIPMTDFKTYYGLRNGLLYGGIGLLVIGGIVLATGIGEK